MVLLVQRVSPLGEPLFCEIPIFSCPALGQTLKVPPLRIWVADHNQGNTFSRHERQGRLRFEQTFFVTGFNQSHSL